MSRPHPWSDDYVAAVADQILWNYGTIWNRFTEVDPGISDQRFRDLLAAQKLDELYAEVQRFRETGARIFTGPSAIPDQIFCTCTFPLEYRGVPDPLPVPLEEVEIVHMGDMPSRTPDWQRRGRIGGYSRLLVLTFFNADLAGHPLGIGTPPVLQALDLRENGLASVPEDVLRIRTLRFLNLSDNPLTQLPDLSPLASLEWLGLSRTRLSSAAADEAAARLPKCEIAR